MLKSGLILADEMFWKRNLFTQVTCYLITLSGRFGGSEKFIQSRFTTQEDDEDERWSLHLRTEKICERNNSKANKEL
jgi:hypothetical protein